MVTKKGTIEFSLSIKEYIARAVSKWSVEFSVFMGLVITLYDMELIDIVLLQTFLTIALIGFFIAVMLKFGIAVYKDSVQGIIEINKCIQNSKKSPENKVKNAVKTIENNLPLLEPEPEPEPEFTEELKETIEEVYEETIKEILPEPEPEIEPEVLEGTELD